MANWRTYTAVSAGDVVDADLLPYSDESLAEGSRTRTLTVRSLKTVAGTAPLTINAQTGTTYTLALTDSGIGRLLTLDNAGAITLTVPTNASVAFPAGSVIECAQLGAGLVTITGATGVTVNGTTPGSEASAGQYSAWKLVKLATDTWLAHGELA